MARNRMICNGDWDLHGHQALFILLDTKSFYDHKEDMEDKLKKAGVKPGPILADQLLHNGNTEKRFMLCNWDGEHIKNEQFTCIPKQHPIRKISTYMLKQSNVDLSTLTSIQQRMIRNGLYI